MNLFWTPPTLHRGAQVWPKAVDCETFSPAHASPAMRRRLAGGAPEGPGPLLIYVGRVRPASHWADVSCVCSPGTSLADLSCVCLPGARSCVMSLLARRAKAPQPGQPLDLRNKA